MATNTGVTLAKIRAGTASFQEDNSTFSEEIKAVQKAFKLMGFWGSSASPDGKYGTYSVAAAKGLQSEYNLPKTGNLDKATLAKLEGLFSFSLYGGHSSTPTPTSIATGFDYASQGSSCSAVTNIRSQLIKKGYSVSATGSFDTALTTAVKQFQKDNGLTQDGSVGQQTYCVLTISATSTDWFSNGKATLNPGHLARCGFSGVLLNRNIVELNSALNTYGINTKEKIKHFLAQCMAETVNGTQVVEYGYKAGTGKVAGVSYSPYYGSGCLHLTWDYTYTDFYNYMKSTGVTDAKIYTPAEYATQHVGVNYPARSAGWFWDKYKKLNTTIDWNGSASSICTALTQKIVGSSATASTRLSYYQKISNVLR